MQTLKPARGRGFYLMPIQSDDATVEVENTQTRRKLVLFNNGFGGVSADLWPGSSYRVRVTRPSAVVGYYIAAGRADDGSITLSEPYNYFSEVP